jgi:hypothetical protein
MGLSTSKKSYSYPSHQITRTQIIILTHVHIPLSLSLHLHCRVYTILARKVETRAELAGLVKKQNSSIPHRLVLQLCANLYASTCTAMGNHLLVKLAFFFAGYLVKLALNGRRKELLTQQCIHGVHP